MSEGGSDCRSNLRFATEVPVQTHTLVTRECTAALRSAERYCRDQMEAELVVLRKVLIADVKSTLDDTLSSFQELIHTGLHDKLAAFQHQVCARSDEKITAVVQKIEHFKEEIAPLQGQLALREAQELCKTGVIQAITVLQSEVASLQMKLNTASNSKAPGRKTKTPASRPVFAVPYADHTANTAEQPPVPCNTTEALTPQINPADLARELDNATLPKARIKVPAHSAALHQNSASYNWAAGAPQIQVSEL